MTTIPTELRELAQGIPLAHLSTINVDGSPQITVIWLGVDDDDLASGTWTSLRKCATSNAVPVPCSLRRAAHARNIPGRTRCPESDR